MDKHLRSFSWKHKESLGLLLLAIVLRLVCVPNRSLDYVSYLAPWSDFIVKNGGWQALNHNFANYTPPYLYWLVIANTQLDWMPRLLSVKLLAMAVDFLCAYFVYQIVKLKFPTGGRAKATFFAILFSPTIPVNSALWGQCDVLYTTGLIACLYYLCVGRKNLALLAFGVAFAFKLQSIFLALFFLTLLLRGYVKFWQFLWVPLVYLLAVAPSWLIGRPLLDLLLIYVGQANDNQDLTRNAANLYQWLPNENYAVIMPLGVVVTLLLIVSISGAVYWRKVKIDPEFLVNLFLVSVLVIPFFLPRMHDRYFYPADIGTILFAAFYPQYTWMPVVMQVASLVAYANGDIQWLIKFCSVGVCLVIIYTLRHFYQKYLSTTARPLATEYEP